MMGRINVQLVMSRTLRLTINRELLNHYLQISAFQKPDEAVLNFYANQIDRG